MQRKEALKKLEKLVDHVYDCIKDDGCFDYLPELALKIVEEEIGMSPPFLKYETIIPEGMYLTEDIQDEAVFEWELDSE